MHSQLKRVIQGHPLEQLGTTDLTGPWAENTEPELISATKVRALAALSQVWGVAPCVADLPKP